MKRRQPFGLNRAASFFRHEVEAFCCLCGAAREYLVRLYEAFQNVEGRCLHPL